MRRGSRGGEDEFKSIMRIYDDDMSSEWLDEQPKESRGDCLCETKGCRT